MHLVVPKSLVTFDPSNKTITLSAPFNQIKEVDVLKIRDDTSEQVIYDRHFQRNSITVANGVISYSYDNDYQAVDDNLQVELDFGYYDPKVVMFDSQSVAASSMVTSPVKLYVSGAATIWLLANQTGADSVTLNVPSYEEEGSSASSAIQTATIPAGILTPIIVEVGLPYISLQAANTDSTNASTVDASFLITWR